jgi:serine phosphatase RsbU (regulator of sigma subunit)
VDEQGEPFGLERLDRCFGHNADEPVQAICDQVVEALRARQGQAPQADNITLMAIRALD